MGVQGRVTKLLFGGGEEKAIHESSPPCMNLAAGEGVQSGLIAATNIGICSFSIPVVL